MPAGNAIGGLFAAGEAAGFGGGGMNGKRGLEGTFLGGCLLTGRTAGAQRLGDEMHARTAINIERAARDRRTPELPRFVFDYIDGGAEDEMTLRAVTARRSGARAGAGGR